jgi:site-specific DNA recombinase
VTSHDDAAASRMAAIYARVSTEDQGKGFSIPTQIEACQKVAEREGYTVPDAHVLLDEGISGTTMDRPGLRRLRELVNAQVITAVIVIDPDRLSRNLGHQLLLAEELEQAGVKLLIVSHPMEQGPEGWLFFQMRGALAEYERAKMLERMKRGCVGRAKAGHAWGGQVPLGYRAIREPHKARWEVDPEEAAVIRRIFARCLEGLSVRDIARQLTHDGVLTRLDRGRGNGGSKRCASGIWEQGSVYKILTNVSYTGTAYYGKWEPVTRTVRRLRPQEEWIAIPVPVIIETQLFEAVQAQLRQRKRLARRNRKQEYLLIGGRFRCGRCGRTMSGYTAHNRLLYRCASVYIINPEKGKCRGQIHADDAEAQVWRAVEEVLQQPEIIAAEVQRHHANGDERRAEVQRELDLVPASLGKCDREEQRWAKAYADEVISLDELKGYRAEIVTRRQSLLVQQAALQARLQGIGEAIGQVEALVGYCERVRQRLHTFDILEKRLALDALDIQVTWTPGQPLAIQGTIPLGEIVPTPSRRCTLLPRRVGLQ